MASACVTEREDSLSSDAPQICAVEGCERPFRARSNNMSLCRTHYELARRNLPLRPIKHKLAAGTYSRCSFEGCERPHSASGYCSSHYQQVADGRPLTAIRGWKSQAEWGPTCRYSQCEGSSHSRGLCIVHYGRGISQFARDAIFALQGGRCLCGATDPGLRGWQLDHAHTCDGDHKPQNYCASCVRGLLCIACNRHAIAWYEGTYMQLPGNPPIPLFEEWIGRRIYFDGELDSSEVTARYVTL